MADADSRALAIIAAYQNEYKELLREAVRIESMVNAGEMDPAEAVANTPYEEDPASYGMVLMVLDEIVEAIRNRH